MHNQDYYKEEIDIEQRQGQHNRAMQFDPLTQMKNMKNKGKLEILDQLKVVIRNAKNDTNNTTLLKEIDYNQRIIEE